MTNPLLDASRWLVLGQRIVAWINDVECFDITATEATNTFALRHNNVATATTLLLGESSTVAEAIHWAACFTVGEVPGGQQLLCCSHGTSIGLSCRDCDDDPPNRKEPRP